MSIAIIIVTHGASADALLKSTEMIIGQQVNVATTDFVPGENTEILASKLHQKLKSLDTTSGVLFLVDFWGGSPFNASNQLLTNYPKSEIVTGVNIPMLVEVFMGRDDNPSLSELAVIALQTGKEGIRTLKTPSTITPHSEAKTAPTAKRKSSSIPAGGHMTLSLVRIDDRLIHGQVATRWTKDTNVNRIVVVSDEVANDKIRSTLLKQVAPPGVTASVVEVEKMIRVYNNPKYAKDRVMLLFTNPSDVLKLVEAGVKITSVNIGGISYKEGKTQVNNAVSVSQEDIKAFKQLNALGLELEIRKVASDSKISMMNLLTKLS